MAVVQPAASRIRRRFRKSCHRSPIAMRLERDALGARCALHDAMARWGILAAYMRAPSGPLPLRASRGQRGAVGAKRKQPWKPGRGASRTWRARRYQANVRICSYLDDRHRGRVSAAGRQTLECVGNAVTLAPLTEEPRDGEGDESPPTKLHWSLSRPSTRTHRPNRRICRSSAQSIMPASLRIIEACMGRSFLHQWRRQATDFSHRNDHESRCLHYISASPL